jgi:hypothetical protein
MLCRKTVIYKGLIFISVRQSKQVWEEQSQHRAVIWFGLGLHLHGFPHFVVNCGAVQFRSAYTNDP